LAFLADADTHYPLAQGADMIGGLRRQSSSEKRLVYYFMTADMVNAVREVNPPAGVEEFRCEIRLSSFKPHKVRLLDPNGQELIGARAAGLTRFPLRGSRGVRPPQTSAIVDVLGLSEDQPRTLLFEHRERNFAAIATLSVGDFPDKQPKDVRLLPAASITLRLVDGEDRPVADGHAYVGLAGDEERLLHAIGNPVQTNDQIVINRLPPNVKYTLRGYSTQNNLAITRQVGPLKPGEQFDLGEVKLTANAEGTSPQQADGPSSDQTSSRAESSPAKNKLVTSEKATQPEKVNEADSTTSAGDGAAIGESGMATVRGQIVRPDGRPAATAHVAAIARRIVVGRGADLTPNGDALGEATADEMGRYELMLPINVAETHRDAYLLARADGTALSWQKLNLDAANVEASFKLKPAEPLTGRLVDLEGQPAAGVQLTIQSLQRTVLGFAIPIDGVGLPRSKSLPAAWPPPVTSDEQGRFTIDGAPAGYGVVLTVGGNDRFAPQELAFNTGMHETRGERDATYRPQFVKNAKPGEDIVAPLAPAQIFAGRVTYEDTGEGAPFAPVQIWASQQQFGGSMISIGGRADAEGRYRLNPHPGVRFGLTAYAPKSAPYLSRRTNDIVWESGAREKEINLKLPRGVDVRGQVIEEVSGKPVAAASVQYVPEELYNPNVRDDILTGWQAIEPTDAQGRFEIVVLPGPGRLLVHGPDGRFVLREISSGELYKGQRGGRRNYVHGIARIEPEKAAEPLAVTIRLERGSAVRGELVDEQGTSIDEALMISRLYISPYSLFWRGFPQSVLGGRFELGGLAPGQEYPVHFIDPKRRLGATVRLKAGTDASRVVLVPCGSAVMRFVDEKGNGIAGHNPTVKLVVTPGTLDWNRTAEEAKTLAADEDFIANIDRLNHGRLYADAEGRVELPALIPGANYRVTTVRNEKLVVAKDFQAKSGETIDLGDIVYERGEK
jgi:hypothetical protein